MERKESTAKAKKKILQERMRYIRNLLSEEQDSTMNIHRATLFRFMYPFFEEEQITLASSMPFPCCVFRNCASNSCLGLKKFVNSRTDGYLPNIINDCPRSTAVPTSIAIDIIRRLERLAPSYVSVKDSSLPLQEVHDMLTKEGFLLVHSILANVDGRTSATPVAYDEVRDLHYAVFNAAARGTQLHNLRDKLNGLIPRPIFKQGE